MLLDTAMSFKNNPLYGKHDGTLTLARLWNNHTDPQLDRQAMDIWSVVGNTIALGVTEHFNIYLMSLWKQVRELLDNGTGTC